MNNSIIVIAMLLLISVPAAWAKGEVGPDGNAAAFASAAEQMRLIWHLMVTQKQASLRSTMEDKRAVWAQQDTQPPRPWKAIRLYLSARAAILLENDNEARKVFASAIDVTVAPEVTLAMLELRSDMREKQPYVRCLSELIPVGVWRRQLDGAESDITADIKPPRQDVPLASHVQMKEVAEVLDSAGLFELAWKAYVEAIYSGLSPAWIRQKLDKTWLSPEAAGLWYRAALCADKTGRKELAWSYLMKAAVFGSDDLYQKAIETAKRFEEGSDGTLKPVTTDACDRSAARGALMKVVAMYEEMNMHPRAWALIDTNRNVFENPDKLRKDVEERWLVVVKDVSRATTKVVLYGQEVYPNGHPLKVVVPWPLSAKAITSAAKCVTDAGSTTRRAVSQP